MSVRSAVRAAAPAAAIFLLAGCLLALAYYHDNKYLSPPPYGADGVLELTDADLGRPVPLVDGWLLSVDGAPAAEAFIGQYSNFSFAPGGTSAFGSAVYELELRYDGDAPERALVLLVPEVYGDFTLYVDGAVAAAGGDGAQVGIVVRDGTRLELEVENRERYDYRKFLRKFAVLKETVQVDPDSFDYVFYHYGMELYGNMPLIEPLETKELRRVEDFVIVIDTSMSCSGELVQQFLEETYSVLTQSETYFKKVNIHIIQCDDQVREDVTIASAEALKAYMERITLNGCGGTDFRPAFQYVDKLVRKQQFSRLKGLLYFTDGRGIYPVRRPVYDTAFVFMEQDFLDVDVPPWAIKIILSPEDLGRDVEEKG